MYSFYKRRGGGGGRGPGVLPRENSTGNRTFMCNNRHCTGRYGKAVKGNLLDP